MRYGRARGVAAFLLFPLPKPFVKPNSRTASADGPAHPPHAFSEATDAFKLRSVLAWMVPARLPSAPVEQRRKRRLVIESSGATRSVARDERSDVKGEEWPLNPFALNE
jgi:hypothetical protein